MVVAAGLTLMDCVAAEVDHAYVPPAILGFAVKTTLEPGHITPSLLAIPEDSTAEIETVGGVFSVTTTDSVALVQPFRV